MRPLLMLQAAAGLIWLIACANVANHMLSRPWMSSRQRTARLTRRYDAPSESRVARRIGRAGHRRHGRCLMLASTVLRLIAKLGSSQLPRIDDAALDGRSLIVAALFTAVTTIVIAALPALARADTRPRVER